MWDLRSSSNGVLIMSYLEIWLAKDTIRWPSYHFWNPSWTFLSPRLRSILSLFSRISFPWIRFHPLFLNPPFLFIPLPQWIYHDKRISYMYMGPSTHGVWVVSWVLVITLMCLIMYQRWEPLPCCWNDFLVTCV